MIFILFKSIRMDHDVLCAAHHRSLVDEVSTLHSSGSDPALLEWLEDLLSMVEVRKPWGPPRQGARSLESERQHFLSDRRLSKMSRSVLSNSGFES